ncbi:hypothetical protein GK047_18295 [Paenibacillus sp. SYP-B3998]|uniref:Uncharacterized protein n=1 Tax=Paenibacillus sp. SYP-B3998 TaxID=2678564 RepID=A0A6G4A0G1_9BACL|nr:hypothetical protein [Paenibacillus sp. SYP-B3998]NEW07953.1 hypothetical protein [Paenibacillus sp. SYP-B3998]
MNYPPSYFPQPYSPYDGYPPPNVNYSHPAYWIWERERAYPHVDTKILMSSVDAFQRLMNDASLLLKKLADPQIASQLMTAAQTGNQKEVDRIVSSFGCESAVATSFTPSSVKFSIDPLAQGIPCCDLSMSLKWGE